MAASMGGGPPYSGYGQQPKIRFEIIGEAWQLFTQQMGTWVMGILVMFAGIIIPTIFVTIGLMGSGLLASGTRSEAGQATAGIGMLLVMVLGMLLMGAIVFLIMGGLFRMAVKQVRGLPIQVSDVWSVTDVFWKLVGAGFLMGLAVSVSALFCYLPAFIVGGLLMLTIPLIVDQKMGVMDAMTRSWNTLKQEWLMAAVLYFVLSLIGSAGIILVYIGMLFTYPLFFLGTALVYRDFILGGGGGNLPPQPGYPAGVTPGGYPPTLYASQPPPPPSELR